MAQPTTDSSSLRYIYSSSWDQRKLMHPGNFFIHLFFFPPSFSSTKTALSQSFPSLWLFMWTLNWSCPANKKWSNLLEPVATQQHAICSFIVCQRPSQGRGEKKSKRWLVHLFTSHKKHLHKSWHCSAYSLLTTFDPFNMFSWCCE